MRYQTFWTQAVPNWPARAGAIGGVAKSRQPSNTFGNEPLANGLVAGDKRGDR